MSKAWTLESKNMFYCSLRTYTLALGFAAKTTMRTIVESVFEVSGKRSRHV